MSQSASGPIVTDKPFVYKRKYVFIFIGVIQIGHKYKK